MGVLLSKCIPGSYGIHSLLLGRSQLNFSGLLGLQRVGLEVLFVSKWDSLFSYKFTFSFVSGLVVSGRPASTSRSSKVRQQ